MKILISAAETSSDAHGAELLRALRGRLAPGAEPGTGLDAFGIGGPRLQAEGLRAVVDARELLAMGFGEIIGRLPRILKALGELDEAAKREKPDLAIVMDYPDFHFRLARRLKTAGIPAIYYIPPKVWVWRKGRIRLLRDLFVEVLCIFPFEESLYREMGVRARYVGNPLLDELPLALTREKARSDLGLSETEKAVVLLPGSRPSELRRHVDLLLDSTLRAAALLRARGWLGARERLRVLIPYPSTVSAGESRGRVENWLKSATAGASDFILDVRVSSGDAHACMVAADAGLIKSGTSTLEAALLGCRHAVVYRTSLSTQFIFRHLVRYRGPVGLVNLVHGARSKDEYLAREILLDEATPERLADELVRLLTDEAARAEMGRGFAELRSRLDRGSSPSLAAAEEIERVLRELGKC